MAPTFYDAMRSGGLSAGDVVLSLAGHDRGSPLLVLSVEPPYACLADGRLRLYSKAKRKRIRHVKAIGRIDEAEAKLARLAALQDGVAREAAVRSLLDGFFEERNG